MYERILCSGRKSGAADCLSPLTSLVGFELASRTGPSQDISKKTLMVMFAGDVEKFRLDRPCLMGE